VRNAAPLSVEADHVTSTDLRVNVRGARVNGIDLADRRVEVPGGESVDVEVDYTRDCESPGLDDGQLELRLTVRTVVGLERTLSLLDGFDFLGIACT
jgi:hypothetical protein